MDEQMISVPCSIPGCNARVNGSTRCHEHGGAPDYEWRTSDFGDVTYIVNPQVFNRQPESEQLGGATR